MYPDNQSPGLMLEDPAGSAPARPAPNWSAVAIVPLHSGGVSIA